MISKLRKLEKGQRLQYFKDYYLLKIIAGIVILAFVVSFLKDTYNNKKVVLNISYVNVTLEDNGLSFLTDDVRDNIGLKNGKKIAVSFAGSIRTMEDANNAYALSSKLLVGNPDILIADEVGYRTLAFSKPFLDMDEEFKNDDEMKKIIEKYGVKNKDIDGNESYVDAIDITDTNFAKNYISTNDDSRIYFTIAVGSSHMDYVKKVIKYLEES